MARTARSTTVGDSPGHPAGSAEVVVMGHPATTLLSIVAGLSMAVSAAVTPAVATASPASGPVVGAVACPADGTKRTTLPGAHASLATDVAVLGGRATWIVGMHAGQGIPRRPWIVRRSGSGWQEVAAAPTGFDGGLMAVDALDSELAVAVGFHTTSRFLRPISQRWDGRRWIAVGVPSSSPSEALVDVAIASRTSAWAVGFRTTRRGPAPVAMELRGGRWQRHDPVLPGGMFGSLVAVDVTSDGEPWAVGWQGDGSAPRPLVVRFSAGRWTRVPVGLASTEETVLTGVDARARGGVRVLGYTQAGTMQRAVLWQRDGSGWSADGTLAGVAGAMLPMGLSSDSAGRPLISGAWRGARGEAYAGMVGVRSTDGWRIARGPDEIRGPSALASVAWSDRSALAVGWMGGEGVADTLCQPERVALAELGTRGTGRVLHDGSLGSGRSRSGADGRDAATRPMPRVSAATGIHFRDIARTVGLPAPTTSYGATVLDLDGDGWDDLLISRHTERGRLLRNRHGRFVSAPSDPLPAFDRHGCTAADFDRDGHVDAFCAVGAARGAKLKNNELWTDLWTRKARQVAPDLGVDDPLGRGRRATFLDLDGDPYQNLLVTSDPLRVDGLPSLERAFRNDGGKRFVAAGDLGLDLPIGGSCALAADLDGDGRQEVVICAEEAWGTGPGVHIFRRSEGRFRDVTAAMGIDPASDVDAAAADLDGDGRQDLVQLSRGRLAISLQRHGRLVRVATLAATAGTAIGIGDANGDGRPDLYVVEGGMGRNADDQLLLNGGGGRSWRSVAIPQARAGTADDVVVLDVDHNGTDDFLVLNGAQTAGPVQLIAGFR